MPAWTMLAMAVAFAFADRFAGGDYVTKLRARAKAAVNGWPSWIRPEAIAVLNARSVAWATVALALILAVLGAFTSYGPSLSVLALGFAAWRWTGWTTFSGSIDPKTRAQRLGLFERHALAIPAFTLPLALGLQLGQPWAALADIIVMTLFALAATLLGMLLAAEERPGVDINAVVEAARGFFLGGLLAILLL